MSLVRLGHLLRERRGARHLREVAREVGVSAATLSRVESGRLPDLETFSKLCAFLEIDPAKMLGLPDRAGGASDPEGSEASVSVHFKTDRTYSPELASDLAALILAAQRYLDRATSR